MKIEDLPKFTQEERITIFAREFEMDNNYENISNSGIRRSTQEIELFKQPHYDMLCYSDEYVDDNYVFEREMEHKYFLKEDFLKDHSITLELREGTLNYLLHICNYVGVPAEILHLSVAIFDRFLQEKRNTPVQFLNLLAIGSLRIALKVEHRQSDLPFTSELGLLTDREYSSTQILSIEKKICSVLEFNVVFPSPVSFLHRCNRLVRMTILEHTLAMYLIEIFFLNYRTCTIKPSLQGAAAYCLSRALLKNEEDLDKIWTAEMEYTSYTLSTLRPVIRLLVHSLLIIGNAGTRSILYKKYAQPEYFLISTFQQLKEPAILSRFR
ncbi:G2/mitotic-specific cyclin-B1-like [Coccinella septempunctata]|uniref:G2/mitotic-specific cyclin-B1-like n=1 Tax=Coccinella septempunctata TaxID=41139 RepID=UPI001D05D3E8|nr:G2/mitotic-specific cyclin-B1-like [Coccinella septempunctata]